MASPNAPQPQKRTKFIKVVDSECKMALVSSFEGFNASQVSREHIERAEACINSGCSRDERYRLVPFEKILFDNQVNEELYVHIHMYICMHAHVVMHVTFWNPRFSAHMLISSLRYGSL